MSENEVEILLDEAVGGTGAEIIAWSDGHLYIDISTIKDGVLELDEESAIELATNLLLAVRLQKGI